MYDIRFNQYIEKHITANMLQIVKVFVSELHYFQQNIFTCAPVLFDYMFLQQCFINFTFSSFQFSGKTVLSLSSVEFKYILRKSAPSCFNSLLNLMLLLACQYNLLPKNSWRATSAWFIKIVLVKITNLQKQFYLMNDNENYF